MSGNLMAVISNSHVEIYLMYVGWSKIDGVTTVIKQWNCSNVLFIKCFSVWPRNSG